MVDGDRHAVLRRSGRAVRPAGQCTWRALTAPGARVAILMRNRLEYIECDFAIARAGMVKVPINPRLSDDERRYILADSGAAVADHRGDRAHTGGRSAGRPDRAPDRGGRRQPGDETSGYDALLSAAQRRRRRRSRRDPERLSQLLYTSGTTGRPKGAMLADRCRVTATVMTLAEEFCATPDDGMIHAGPLSHGSGSKVLTFFTRGARSITMPQVRPGRLLRLCRERAARRPSSCPPWSRCWWSTAARPGPAAGSAQHHLRGRRHQPHGARECARGLRPDPDPGLRHVGDAPPGDRAAPS